MLKILIAHLDHDLGTTRPGVEKIAALIGASQKTVYNYLAKLNKAGLMATVATGCGWGETDPGYRPPHRTNTTVNERAVYALCLPTGNTLADPADNPPINENPNKDIHNQNRGQNCSLKRSTYAPENPIPRARTPKLSLWDEFLLTHRPRGRAVKRLFAAFRLKKQIPALRNEPERRIAAQIKALTDAGYSNADLIYAIDHHPDGPQWTYDTRVRKPNGWLRSRLSHWIKPDGSAIPSPSQERTAERQKTLDKLAARRQQDAELAAAAAADRAEAAAQGLTMRQAAKLRANMSAMDR
jgi:hypothetical protein